MKSMCVASASNSYQCRKVISTKINKSFCRPPTTTNSRRRTTHFFHEKQVILREAFGLPNPPHFTEEALAVVSDGQQEDVVVVVAAASKISETFIEKISWRNMLRYPLRNLPFLAIEQWKGPCTSRRIIFGRPMKRRILNVSLRAACSWL